MNIRNSALALALVIAATTIDGAAVFGRGKVTATARVTVTVLDPAQLKESAPLSFRVAAAPAPLGASAAAVRRAGDAAVSPGVNLTLSGPPGLAYTATETQSPPRADKPAGAGAARGLIPSSGSVVLHVADLPARPTGPGAHSITLSVIATYQ